MRPVESVLTPVLRALRAPGVTWVALGVAIAAFGYTWLYYPISQGHTGDFLAALTHRDYGEDFWDGRGVGYGPVFALYDLGFRGVRDLPAMRIMFAANLAMLATTFFVAVRRFLPPPRAREEWVAAAFLFVCFYPTFQALRQNNVEVTELFLLVLMLEALRARRDWTAGALLGAAGATKILPFALVVYFLWRRRFRVAAASVATGVLLLVIVIALKGESLGDTVREWSSNTGIAYPLEFQGNQSLSGFWYRAFSSFDLSTDHGVEYPTLLDADAARIGTLVTTAALFLLVAALVIRNAGFWPHATSDVRVESVEIALVLAAVLVLIPRNHTHYFALISWAYIAALREWPLPRGRAGRWAVSLALASYATLGSLLAWRLLDPVLRSIGPVTGIDLARLASLPLAGALALIAALLMVHRELTRPEPREVPTSAAASSAAVSTP